MKRLAFLASGSGSLVDKILQEIQSGILSNVDPVLLISDRNSKSIEIGSSYNLETRVLPFENFSSRDEFSDAILRLLSEHTIDFCFLTFDRLLSGKLLDVYMYKLINIHPSLLPLFPGYNTTQKALNAGCQFVGATCHFLDAGKDTGKIINQAILPISPIESTDAINHRLFLLRVQLALQAIYAFVNDKILVENDKLIVIDGEYNGTPINPIISMKF